MDEFYLCGRQNSHSRLHCLPGRIHKIRKKFILVCNHKGAGSMDDRHAWSLFGLDRSLAEKMTGSCWVRDLL